MKCISGEVPGPFLRAKEEGALLQLFCFWLVHCMRLMTSHQATDHPAGPPNARSVAVAADRTEGDTMIEGVGEDSGESEWRVAGVGDGCVE